MLSKLIRDNLSNLNWYIHKSLLPEISEFENSIDCYDFTEYLRNDFGVIKYGDQKFEIGNISIDMSYTEVKDKHSLCTRILDRIELTSIDYRLSNNTFIFISYNKDEKCYTILTDQSRSKFIIPTSYGRIGRTKAIPVKVDNVYEAIEEFIIKNGTKELVRDIKLKRLLDE